jgi:predicted RNase H-like nuclease (RuvC/YqgF family)
MVTANRVMWCSLLAGCALVLFSTRGGADEPPASTQPATQPVTSEARPGESARDHLQRAADTLELMGRVRDLERIVSELARHLGGPTRNLNIRPPTDLNSILEKIDRELQDLKTELSRLRRDVDDLERRMDRLERRG